MLQQNDLKLKTIQVLCFNMMVFFILALLEKNTRTLLTFPPGYHLRGPYFCSEVISFKIAWAEDLICSILFITRHALGNCSILSTFCSMNLLEAKQIYGYVFNDLFSALSCLQCKWHPLIKLSFLWT